MTKEQAKEEVKKTGIKKGYRLDHPEDWYEGLTNDDLMEYIDNRKIRHLFRDINSIIIELFPTLLEWKFKRMANGWWDKEENFLKFIKWSKKHVWTKPEDLYNVDSNIIDIYSSVLKSKYNIHELSKILYPEYEFLPFLFKKNKKEWWDDINNQIIFLKWLEKRLGWNKPEDWYKIKSDMINGNYGIELLKRYCVNNVAKILYPDFDFLEWEFTCVSANWWINIENVRKYLMWLGKKLNWNKPEDWYRLTKKHLEENNGSNLRHVYKIHDLPNFLYPNFEFYPWLFNINRNWRDINIIIKYLKWLEKELGWSKPEDWYKINADIFKKYHGAFLVENYKVSDLPKILYPEYNFDIFKFNTVGNNYWDDFENVKNVILEFYNENNRMPTKNECENINGKNVSSGVSKHGGINKVAKKLNINTSNQYKTLSGDIVKSSYEVIFANFCYLNNISFVYEEKIIEGKGYKYDFKIDDIYVEIWGYEDNEYDKKRKIKEFIYKENNLKYIFLEFTLFIKPLNFINSELIKGFMINNIKKDSFYYGNLNVLKKCESFNKDMIINDLKNECEKNNFTTFPMGKWWCENGFQKHIGFLFRNKISLHDIAVSFGLKQTMKKQKYYKEFENVKNEINLIINKLNRFPKNKEINGGLLSGIISHHGGLMAVKAKMGY